MMGILYEKRPLKRPRLGPPDVYPQEPKQKEDELSLTNVKHGFTTIPQLADEFGTARSSNVTAAKVGAYFNAILAKKEELATMPDTGRKRQQINPKDNFWPVTARTKNGIEAWFKDLSGSKPLVALAKKAPNFNKKEEIFMMLCEYQVPMLRAAWFIKLSSAYTVAVSEAKLKKRQLPDPTTEWTGTLIKFLKDQLSKLQEYYHMGNHVANTSNNSSTTNNSCNSNGTVVTNNSSNNNTSNNNNVNNNNNTSNNNNSVNNQPPTPTSSSQPVTGNTMNEEHKLALKQWHYCVQLAKYMFEEGLLDRQELLQWILELLDKIRSSPSEDGILKLLLPLALQYLEEFIQSELLARRLAYLCCRKLAHMCNNIESNNNPQSPSITKNEVNGSKDTTVAVQGPLNPLTIAFNDYLTCAHHRDIIYSLSTIIQVITLECPTSLVWNSVGEGKAPSVLNGSPLDYLPCPPAALPCPPASSGNPTMKQLRIAQENIKARSQAAEGRWSCDKWQQSSAGTTTTKVLAALDALDRHSFDRMDASNSLDTLYAKIFTPPPKDNCNERDTKTEYNPQQDSAVVEILCEWAVSAERWGEHRAMAVAKLLEKRQSEATGETNDNDDKDSTCSNGSPPVLPIFQPLLMKFLDVDAPVLDNTSVQSKAQFTNLVHLFSELIRHDVFSHDAYMCTLISRGDLIQGNINIYLLILKTIYIL